MKVVQGTCGVGWLRWLEARIVRLSVGVGVRGPSISDSRHTTPIMAVQLQLCSCNSGYIYGLPPHHRPHCARLTYLLYSHFLTHT